MSVPGDMSVAKSLADVLSRVAAASTRAGRAAPVRTRSRTHTRMLTRDCRLYTGEDGGARA